MNILPPFNLLLFTNYPLLKTNYLLPSSPYDKRLVKKGLQENDVQKKQFEAGLSVEPQNSINPLKNLPRPGGGKLPPPGIAHTYTMKGAFKYGFYQRTTGS